MVRVVVIHDEIALHPKGIQQSNTEGVDALGYIIEPPITCPADEYLGWRVRQWRETGNCPDPGFCVAKQSAWLESLPGFIRRGFRHYVVDGRDGYVELIARNFKWREWLWTEGERDLVPERSPVVGEGQGVS